MTEPRALDELATPAAIVDIDRMRTNLDRMAAYTREHGIALRPHIKTHKVPALARAQLERGAAGVTVATVHEATIMAAVANDILIAYPPVGAQRLQRILALPETVRVTVGLDSAEALNALAAASSRAGRTIGVLVELDLGMHRVGLPDIPSVIDLARRAREAPGVQLRGLMFYPGHIREHVSRQTPALWRLREDLQARRDALAAAGLAAEIVSGGSTPTAYASHTIGGMTEMRPGTYIFSDRTTAEIGASQTADCAYTVLATVVSVAVPGQAVVDAGSKALGREPLRGAPGEGFGALLDAPGITVHAMSEEHGLLDLSDQHGWRPRVGDRVRIVPNHVCYSVNLHPVLWGVRDDVIVDRWEVAGRP